MEPESVEMQYNPQILRSIAIIYIPPNDRIDPYSGPKRLLTMK